MERHTLRQALVCLFTSGMTAVPRGAQWGLVLGLPAGCYCFFTVPYGGGLMIGPLVALAVPLAGAFVAFHVGATMGLYRDGYRVVLLLVPALAAAIIMLPYGLYKNERWAEKEHRRLIVQLQSDDPAPFLTRLQSARSRGIVRDHLEQFLICAGRHSNPETIDALAARDPRGTEGFALCGVAQYGLAAAVSHLLGEGLQPTRAHRLNGQPCEPLLDLLEAATSSSPCSGLDESDRFMATPTAEGCKRRAEVAALLLEAGASSGGTTQVYDRPHDGALDARSAGVVELARNSHCDELVRVVERHGKPSGAASGPAQ